MGRVDGRREIGVQSRKKPAVIFPDSSISAEDLNSKHGRASLIRRGPDCRDKMRPDAMMIEMTEDKQYSTYPRMPAQKKHHQTFHPQCPMAQPVSSA